MTKENIELNEVAEIALRWARHSVQLFPKWEVEEIQSEAFLLAVHYIKSGRYKPELASLSTFLWKALPLDIKHRYRKQQGERRLTNKDGKKRYTKIVTLFPENFDVEDKRTVDEEPELTIIGTTTSEWLNARLAGYTATDLRRRGMNYDKQAEAAKEFRDEQQRQREKG